MIILALVIGIIIGFFTFAVASGGTADDIESLVSDPHKSSVLEIKLDNMNIQTYKAAQTFPKDYESKDWYRSDIIRNDLRMQLINKLEDDDVIQYRKMIDHTLGQITIEAYIRVGVQSNDKERDTAY